MPSEMPDLPLNQVQGDDAAAEALNAPLRRIAVVVGDLTQPDPAWGLDTVVNSANHALTAAGETADETGETGGTGGTGMNASLHAAAGPRLDAFTRTLGGCPTGLARLTPAFDLETAAIRRIIHVVGPTWSGVADTGVPGAPGDETAALGYTLEDTQLASGYASALRLAVEAGARGIGFPAIGTGAGGFPPSRAARIAFGHVFGHFSQRPTPELPEKVTFVCFDEDDAALYRETIATRAQWMLGRKRA